MNRKLIKILINSEAFASNCTINTPSKHCLINLASKLPYSSFSLQIVSNSNPKSLSNPFYHLLPKTQNPSNVVSIIYSSLREDNSRLSHLRDEIRGLLPHLGTNEISRVLLRCQSDSIAAITFFNWVKNDLSLNPSTQNYCLLLHILAWSKEFKQAMAFMSELIKAVKHSSHNEDLFQSLILCCEDCNWDPVIFDMLIKAYVKEGMIKEGFRSFIKIVEFGFVPSVVSTNCLLNGLLKMNCIDQCWRVYAKMGIIGIHPNTCTFNILTQVFCLDSDISKVNLFLEKMEEEGFEPDIVTYNTLISCYCRKQRLNDAFYLYRIMYRRNVLPDLVTYTTLMNALCKERRLREAHQLFHRMIHRGLNPDIVSFNTLICAYCKEGKMQEARSLLHEMIGNRICPDDFTCRVFVEGHRKEGRMISALNLIVELERYAVPISWDIYDYLIVSVCDEDRPFAAKNLLGRILPRGYVPSVEIYCKLIESLCKNDSFSEALELKDEMRSLKPKLDTCKALMCCLCRMGRIREAELFMEEMVQFDMLLDPEICRELVQMYCKEKDVGKAESLLEFFAWKFQIFDTESYNILVKTFCEFADANKVIELQERMLKLGFAPNNLSFKQMIHALWKVKEKEKFKLLQ